MIDAESIKPKVKGKADFYSWQLYRFIKKNPTHTQIFSAPWDPVNGFDGDGCTLFIGLKDEEGWVSGMELRSLCRVRVKIETFAYAPGLWRTKEWRDITESFWEQYKKKGVCAIHGDYAHKWIYNEGETGRICEHCGKEQAKFERKVTQYYWQALEA